MPPETTITFKLRGAHREAWACRDDEILCEGPAGTGKTRSWLELINVLCHTYPGLRVLMLRKTMVSMAASCLAEFKQHVLHPGDRVAFFGGSKDEPASFRYANGSVIAVGGLDRPEAYLSSFFDIVYINEATECTLEDLETISTRLRAPEQGKEPKRADGTPFTYRRILMDCNPTYESHWLMQRSVVIDAELGVPKTTLIRSVLEDNPAYFTDDGVATEAGAAYLRRLNRLTGTRRERFLLGKRVGVPDACYPAFNRELHIRPLEPGLYFPVTILGVDYGTKHECAICVLSIDQYRRRWVREVWYEADTSEGKNLRRQIGLFRDKYQARRGRVDPNQGFLGGTLGYSIARGAGGSRLHRIDLCEPLFYVFPNGRVPDWKEDLSLAMPDYGDMPDSPGVLLVEGAPGIDQFASELEGYHFVWQDTPKGRTKDVYRVDENGVAAFEYANEEFEEAGDGYIDPLSLITRTQQITRKPTAPLQQGGINRAMLGRPSSHMPVKQTQVITYRNRGN